MKARGQCGAKWVTLPVKSLGAVFSDESAHSIGAGGGTIPFAFLDALMLGGEWTGGAAVAQGTRDEVLAVILAKRQ